MGTRSAVIGLRGHVGFAGHGKAEGRWREEGVVEPDLGAVLIQDEGVGYGAAGPLSTMCFPMDMISAPPPVTA